MISKRLIEVSKMIDHNKVVFDVGSDHGQLPCFLVKQNIVSKAYAGDNKVGPLENAKKSIQQFHLENNVIPVLSDGLEKAPEDVDVVTICGMGYFTIGHILDTCDPTKYDYFVIQSNTDVNLLRQYISDHHWTILDESIVYDGFYYQIVKFNTDNHDSYSDLQIQFGPILMNNRSTTYIDYLNFYKTKLEEANSKSNSYKFNNAIKDIKNILK